MPKPESPSRRSTLGEANWLGAILKLANLLRANPKSSAVDGDSHAALPTGHDRRSIRAGAAASHVEVVLPSGLLVRVPAQDTAALRTVLELLEPQSC